MNQLNLVPPHKFQFTFHPDSLFKLFYALYGLASYSLHLFQIAGRRPEHSLGGMKAAYKIAIAYAAQAFNKTQGQPMICILLHRCRYLLSKKLSDRSDQARAAFKLPVWRLSKDRARYLHQNASPLSSIIIPGIYVR
jgi:hypothetical protein